MKEIWKDIKGYKNYQVSNFGKIKSKPRMGSKGGLLKPFSNYKGYLLVTLFKNKQLKHYQVHRLVYEAFYGKIPFWMQVNHLNERKNDNRLENLNLMTPKQNINWGTRNERIKIKLSKPVLQFDLNGKFIKEWLSASEAARQLGLLQDKINLCCNGKRNTTGGYIWKYKMAG